ncbi:glyoxalase [Flavobacteriaceae bacterium AU392]|nr:glyoxalase [Flavobacteriaceae bacterium]RKM85558.1 glyoxalase [Flavobacteriaceae bacterium AU392]
MNDKRLHDLLSIRPQILAASVNNQMSDDERFQNVTLRPILKLQHSLFIEVFRNYITKHKSVFYDLSLEKRIDYIENAIHKDMKFRNSVKGMVIGQFTVDEYKVYTLNSSALNKRMMNMVKDRLLSSIQLFEKPEGILQII